MKLCIRSCYGMRAIIELAQHEGKQPLRLRVIADRQGISWKYLEQLMSLLRLAGFVRSVKGPKGGYVLARPAGEIKVSDVFRCLEGRVTMAERGDDKACRRQPSACVARELWMEVEAAIQHVLNSLTLAHLIKKAKVRRPEYQI